MFSRYGVPTRVERDPMRAIEMVMAESHRRGHGASEPVPCILSAKFINTFWLARAEAVSFLKPAFKPLWIMLGCVALVANAPRFAIAAARKETLPPEVVEQHHGPVDITGEKSIYDSKNDSFTVIGNAVMTQGGTILKADQITVMRRLHIAHAVGNVHLIDPELEIWASQADINLQNETMELENAKILAKRNTYHLEGKRIRKIAGQNYTVLNGFFTTCGRRARHPRLEP